jgi:hypothetical protein
MKYRQGRISHLIYVIGFKCIRRLNSRQHLQFKFRKWILEDMYRDVEGLGCPSQCDIGKFNYSRFNSFGFSKEKLRMHFPSESKNERCYQKASQKNLLVSAISSARVPHWKPLTASFEINLSKKDTNKQTKTTKTEFWQWKAFSRTTSVHVTSHREMSLSVDSWYLFSRRYDSLKAVLNGDLA